MALRVDSRSSAAAADKIASRNNKLTWSKDPERARRRCAFTAIIRRYRAARAGDAGRYDRSNRASHVPISHGHSLACIYIYVYIYAETMRISQTADLSTRACTCLSARKHGRLKLVNSNGNLVNTVTQPAEREYMLYTHCSSLKG